VGDFKSGFAFMDFEAAVTGKFRFVHSEETRHFLETLVATSTERTQVLPAKSAVFRAQLGCATIERTISADDLDILAPDDVPLPFERMKPLRNSAHEGRVNPKGIPCLYVATNKDTAMAEVRPWLGAKITVGKFVTVRELKLVDFSRHHDKKINPDVFFGDLPSSEVTAEVWAMVDRAFSRPITENLSTAEYVPTQTIAEMFRLEGFDGLVYKSKLGEGFNLALFDLDSADLVTSGLFSTSNVRYEFAAKDD
jgi:hypothetical protein